MESVDIPQADSLDRLREVVNAVRAGRRDPRAVGTYAHLSDRHASYYLHAARVLGLAEETDAKHWTVTPRGRELLDATPHSAAETSALRRAIAQSVILRAIAPGLLGTEPPDAKKLARRIGDIGLLAPATAMRRARTLLAWRERIREPQGYLFSTIDDSAVPPSVVRAAERPSLRSIRLRRFKSFDDATLHIGPLTVLVGTNASGKSNIRDAFRFLHGIARGYTLAEIIGEKWIEGGVLQWKGIRGGTREATFRHAASFEFDVEFTVFDDKADHRRNASYSIEIEVERDRGSPRVVRERLAVDGRGQFVFDSHPEKNPPSQDDPLHLAVRLRKAHQQGFVGPVVRLISNKPALSQLLDHPEVRLKDIRDHVRCALDAFKSMRFLDLAADAMRLPSLPGQGVLGDRGENLSSVLMELCEDSHRKRALLHWIRELTPMDASDFDFPADQTGRVLVTLIEENGQRTSAHSASDGTLRFLAMIAAFLGSEPASLYFFEELETGLHPSRLYLLLQLIEQQTAQHSCQVIGTTHSPQLLRFLSATSRESAALVYRSPTGEGSRICRVVDLPNARALIDAQDLSRLHSSGWLEDAVLLRKEAGE